jgi:hypothetical protein
MFPQNEVEIIKRKFIYMGGHAFSLRSPCLPKREQGIKGNRHARKRDKALDNREKSTGLPDSGGRPQ